MKLPILKTVHTLAETLLKARGYEFELRRTGDLALGLWRKRLSSRTRPLAHPRRLVMIPGFGDTPLGWLALFACMGGLLKKRFDEVILLDYPGFGGFLSAEKSFENVESLGQAVATVLDELRAETLVGHSLGGYLCGLYAVLCGEGTRAATKDYSGPSQVVLIDPSGVFTDPSEYDEFVGRFQSAAREGFHHLRPHVFGREPIWFKYVVHEFTHFVVREDIRAFLSSIKAEDALMDRLSAIKAPVWLIWGENDTLLPKSHLSIWLKGLSGARARGYLIPGAGHSPHVERPFVTAALLTQILFGREPHNLGARWWKLARQEG